MASPLDAVRRLSASSLNLFLTRAQFAAVELAQARAQIMRWLGLALAGTVLGLMALIAVSALAVILLWDRAGAATLFVLALVYAIGAYALVRIVQRELREAPPLLADTLAELGKDRDALLGRGTEEPPATGAEK